jgi:hypothetical protein
MVATAAVSDHGEAAVAAAIPPKVMLEQCLRRPIERRAVGVGVRLMRRLRGGWGLPRELKMLRDVFMGGSADALALFRCGPISARFPPACQFTDDAGVGPQRCTHQRAVMQVYPLGPDAVPLDALRNALSPHASNTSLWEHKDHGGYDVGS